MFTTQVEDFRYERSLKLSRYVFNGKDILFQFFEEIDSLISGPNKYCKIELMNEFGKIHIFNIDDLKQEIENSDLIYKIELLISGEENAIKVKCNTLESIRQKSEIILLSGNKKWIQECEEKVHKEILPDKNFYRFLWKPIVEFIIWLGISGVVLWNSYINILDINIFEYNILPSDYIFMWIILFIVLFLYKSILTVIVPTFSIKKKATKLFILKRMIIEEKNTVVIGAITSFLIGIILMILQLFVTSLLA